MAKKTKEYRKLPGYKKGFLLGQYTLWEGSDHLLQMLSRVGVEEYRRFYYSDIQAVVTRKTIRGAIQNGVLACLVLIFMLPTVHFDGGWSLFYGLVAAGMLILLLVNIIRGPTCDTRLMTAVQTEKLHSLHRLKNTTRVMNRLRAHIHRSQGTLKREALDKHPERHVNNSSPNRPAQKRQSVSASPLRNEQGGAHLGLFLLLLLEGLLVSMGFFINHVTLTIIGSIAGLCAGICVIVALVKQNGSNIGASLKAITWASLGFVCINFAAGYIISLVFAMQNPDVAYNQWEMFKTMSLLSPWESSLKLSSDIITICGALFLGVPGLVVLHRSRAYSSLAQTRGSQNNVK